MASADADLAALDGRNAMSDQIARAARVHLQTVSGAHNLQKELGTKGYILDRLFGSKCPLARGYKEELIPFIDDNFESFERQVNSTSACTTFAYDVSRVEARYYNGCVAASSTCDLGDAGAVTPVSFQLLIDELRWGRYRGQQLPASLQLLLLPSNGSPAASDPPLHQPPAATPPPSTPVDSGDGGRQNREGTPVQNPRPIQRLRLQPGENTRGILRNISLPVVNGGVFCKRWHLGMTCFSNCQRVRSHVHPPLATVDTVASHLGVERAAAAAAGAG